MLHPVSREPPEVINVPSKNIFSDEKNFHFDGLDGIQSCWHDLRNEKGVNFHRQLSGDSLLI